MVARAQAHRRCHTQRTAERNTGTGTGHRGAGVQGYRGCTGHARRATSHIVRAHHAPRTRDSRPSNRHTHETLDTRDAAATATTHAGTAARARGRLPPTIHPR
eukprot:scaffold13502_cov109-Isochrysis_galbana.AAC.6